jgi:hypothetical protein
MAKTLRSVVPVTVSEPVPGQNNFKPKLPPITKERLPWVEHLMLFLSCQGNTIGFDKNRTICSAQDRPSWDIGSNLGFNTGNRSKKSVAHSPSLCIDNVSYTHFSSRIGFCLRQSPQIRVRKTAPISYSGLVFRTRIRGPWLWQNSDS